MEKFIIDFDLYAVNTYYFLLQKKKPKKKYANRTETRY